MFDHLPVGATKETKGGFPRRLQKMTSSLNCAFKMKNHKEKETQCRSCRCEHGAETTGSPEVVCMGLGTQAAPTKSHQQEYEGKF